MKSLALILFILVVVPVLGAAPRYQVYYPSTQIGWDAAEPSIGVNWSTGNVMFQAGLETLRVTFDDATSPARTNWSLHNSLLTSILSLDPIAFTDRSTNRTFVSQLLVGCSATSYSDDDGDSWTNTLGCGVPSGIDHQSVGGGAYSGFHLGYPRSVYYCSQDLIGAFCSRSDDGGLTFGIGTLVYLITDCDGLHGHVKVGPDGTVYVPNSSCGGKQGVAVSQNNGLTWTVRKITGTTSGNSDPSVAIGANNTLYFGYQGSDGHMHVVVSKDHGVTWSSNRDVGSTAGIQNSVFPAMVAGDDSRAAIAFLGTTTSGDFQDPAFAGLWHLYIANTANTGGAWTLIDVTRNDPVQVGSINVAEGLAPSTRHFTTELTLPLLDRGDRNLLDFIDASVDSQGRVLVGFADGCIGTCVSSPSSGASRSAMATIARQSGGKRLFAIYDPVEPAKPAAPLLSGTRDTAGVHLSWPIPDNGGASITKYKIYRGLSAGSETLIKSISTTSYKDGTVQSGVTYFYRVSAVNSVGEGPLSNEVSQ